MSEVKRFSYDWAGRPLVIEIGEVAKQASGAALVSYGESTVLSASVSNNVASTADFFPLMVLYQEKLYAAGKIPGGFLRREGRPSEHETLVSRLIDRPIRPLFAEGFRNEVQVVNTVLSSDPDCSTAMAAMLGSSLSLMISDIPFEGPIAGVVVGKVDGKLIINPTPEQLEVSDINLTVAGTKDAINMVEAGARFVSEDDMWEALKFGHAEIIKLCEFQEEIVKECGKEKYQVELFHVDPEIEAQVKAYAEEKLIKAIRVEDKLERYAAIDEPNIAAIAVEQSGSFDKTVLITCTSLLNPSANKGRIGLSINLETKVSCVVAFPSRFKNPPGILPAAYCFSWYKTINGKKSWVDATLLETAADNTTLSPYLTKHAPDACLATSPISITSGRPAQLYSKRLISLIFYFSP